MSDEAKANWAETKITGEAETMLNDEADWAYIPGSAAFLVLDKLVETIDRITYSGVCRKWHQIAKEHSFVRQNHKKQLPMLMIPATKDCNKRRLYSVSEGRIYRIHLSVPHRTIIGSCPGGWLAYANHSALQIILINPFNNATTPIRLPPIINTDSGSKFKVKKVILSADPFLYPESYVALAIYGGWGLVGFFRAGRKKWIELDEDLCLCTDFVFHKNLVYAVTNYAEVCFFDLTGIDDHNKPVKLNVVIECGSVRIPRVYLVESTRGELLMIQRSFIEDKVEDGTRKTNNIKVYKLVGQDPTKMELVEMTSLDGDAVFIGFSYSWSVSASEFPNCIPNSIYFTDNHFQWYNNMDGHCDLGLYNVEQGTFGEHYVTHKSDFLFKPAVWVFPPVF